MATQRLIIDNKSREYTCDACDMKFRTKFTLRDHKVTHATEKPFKCGFCDHRSARRYRLKIHELTHLKEKPFKCQYCQMTFALKQQLTRHLSSHSEDKPFECPQCHYRFKSQSYLATHLKNVHSTARNFECHICHKKFKILRDLTRHLYLLHSDERPYSCDQCNYTSKLGYRLKYHKMAVHCYKLFKCPMCRSTFKTTLGLNYHKFLTHSIQVTCGDDTEIDELVLNQGFDESDRESNVDVEDCDEVQVSSDNNGFGTIVVLTKTCDSDDSVDIEELDSDHEYTNSRNKRDSGETSRSRQGLAEKLSYETSRSRQGLAEKLSYETSRSRQGLAEKLSYETSRSRRGLAEKLSYETSRSRQGLAEKLSYETSRSRRGLAEKLSYETSRSRQGLAEKLSYETSRSRQGLAEKLSYETSRSRRGLIESSRSSQGLGGTSMKKQSSSPKRNRKVQGLDFIETRFDAPSINDEGLDIIRQGLLFDHPYALTSRQGLVDSKEPLINSPDYFETSWMNNMMPIANDDNAEIITSDIRDISHKKKKRKRKVKKSKKSRKQKGVSLKNPFDRLSDRAYKFVVKNLKMEPCQVKLERLSLNQIESWVKPDSINALPIEEIKVEPYDDCPLNEAAAIPLNLHVFTVKQEPRV